MITRRTAIVSLFAGLATPVFAGSPPIFSGPNGLAVNGYDVVAYFRAGTPTSGTPSFKLEWNGALWQFSSAENRELFQNNPEAYAPQFGGYCAFAASKGALASTVPEAWTIFEGKLYLNFSLQARQLWSQDIPGNIALAEGFWPAILG